MNFLQIVILIAAVSNIFLGALVLIRNPKAKLNIAFSIFTFTAGLWIVINFLANYYVTNLLFIRLMYVFGIFLVGTTSGWVPIFCFKKLKRMLLIYIISSYILGFIFAVLSFTPFIISKATSPTLLEYGIIFPLWSFFAVLSLISWLVMLFYSFRKASGLEKNQILFVLIGVFLFGGFGMLFSAILPLFGITFFSMLDSPCSLFLIAFTAYAIIKHRLMDIRLVVVRSLAYTLLIFSVALSYILIIYGLASPLEKSLNISPNLTYVLTGFLIAVGFAPLRRLFEKLTSNIFYRERYDPEKVLAKLGDIASTTLDIDNLTYSLLGILINNLKLSWGTFVTEAEGRCVFYGKAVQISCLKLEELTRKKSILVTDEEEENSKTKTLLRKEGISLILPLRVEKEEVGFLVTGEKKSGEIYTKEDIEFLETTSQSLALAIKNSELYEKVLRDKERMKKLLESREELERIQEKFIAVSSGKIEGPLLETKSYLEKIQKDKLSPETRNFLEKILTSSNRSIKLLSKLIEAGELEHQKTNFHFQLQDISSLLEEVVQSFQKEASENNLKLTFKKPRKPLPPLNIDREQLEKAVSYIVENAVKFTKEGEITITANSKKIQNNRPESIIISIEDTGIGITSKQLPHIFEKFYQGDTSLTREYQGTGLGLYVAHLIIKAHGGGIRVESLPKKGSKFEIYLPEKI